eukprot:8342814-Pyramimonas_sp.AAC.1
MGFDAGACPAIFVTALLLGDRPRGHGPCDPSHVVVRDRPGRSAGDRCGSCWHLRCDQQSGSTFVHRSAVADAGCSHDALLTRALHPAKWAPDLRCPGPGEGVGGHVLPPRSGDARKETA